MTILAIAPTNVRFADSDEAHAWAVFFAAQCPPDPTQRERDVAAAIADRMLVVWRERTAK